MFKQCGSVAYSRYITFVLEQQVTHRSQMADIDELNYWILMIHFSCSFRSSSQLWNDMLIQTK